jgi:hypothetical protein
MVGPIILYARVSSNNYEQITSLQNQMDLLSNFSKGKRYNPQSFVAISDVISASNGMSSKLRDHITNNPEKSTVVVTAMDRLTRDVTDIKFIRSHIGTIITVNDNTQYDGYKDWKDILKLIVAATDEIDKLRDRVRATKHMKRKRCSDEELALNAERRSRAVNRLISSRISIKHKNNKLIDDVAEMIQLSQKLTSLADWNKVSKISKKYGGFYIRSDFPKIIDEKPDENEISHHLTKSVITEYVQRIFCKSDVTLDENMTKEFINANINLGKKRATLGDRQELDTDDEIAELTNSLIKISLNKNIKKILDKKDIKIIQNISDKVTNREVRHSSKSTINKRNTKKKDTKKRNVKKRRARDSDSDAMSTGDDSDSEESDSEYKQSSTDSSEESSQEDSDYEKPKKIRKIKK